MPTSACDQLDKRPEQKYLDKLDGRIVSAAFYDRTSTQWRAEEERLQAAIRDHPESNRTYIDAGVRLLELAMAASWRWSPTGGVSVSNFKSR